ncbi:peptidyl-prolyl cis-trans isomerase, EpsD family [Collimonas fungivorans]|uniref:Peptidyl-prolyl cis-trans isomerase, EpsD family n=1 Tax=Collimonas fungivorans TaxID=158899 RepID=A0A127PE43_9BURK|nr:EpsD family peptidyl-prolyl cis-trans isomerase [Collimonas fungivorans]AMO96080.1 peptidyl-prolyl cis-trans isomerase, EpsD family [Collimonas fungivorans]
MLLTVMNLSACDDQKKKTGQVVARINGEEISAPQLEAELQYAKRLQQNGSAPRQTMREQAMEALIDRQLLLDEALRNKIDRDPALIQIIERFKTQAIVQAYLESKAGNQEQPGKAEIESYFHAHPEMFARRKVFEVEQLIIADQDFSAALKAVMDSSKSLNQVAAWLRQRKIAHAQRQYSYSSAELPPEVGSRLQALGRNRLFVMKDGQRDLLCALTELRDSPVAPDAAEPQIERYLVNKKMQETAIAEITRLRAAAKLEYIEKPGEKPAGDIDGNALPVTATSPGKQQAVVRRSIEVSGVAGLK